jgi:predicted ATPase
MIESVNFVNFKALRNTTLPLGRFTLIVGPNGSGKSTAFRALEALSLAPTTAGAFGGGIFGGRRNDHIQRDSHELDFRSVLSAGAAAGKAQLTIRWSAPFDDVRLTAEWEPQSSDIMLTWKRGKDRQLSAEETRQLLEELMRLRVYALDPYSIAAPTTLEPSRELGPRGEDLTVVLDQLRDQDPERFEAFNEELARALPEFDRVLFRTPGGGTRALSLRTRIGKNAIPAADLSDGTLLALALLTIAYLPTPPPLICLEEPDRGIHPRLLRNVLDALYRLSHPDSAGEEREPVQVVVTTHSPYFLDLLKDHPEQVVIAQKEGLDARFERLVDRPDIDEILADAPLGDVWYSGILGGVPARP